MIAGMGLLARLRGASAVLTPPAPISPNTFEGLGTMPVEWNAPCDLARVGAPAWWPDSFSPVTRQTAMSLEVIAKIRNALVAIVSQAPLEAYRDGHPLPNQPSMVAHPERWRAPSLTYGWLADQMFFYGRAWLVCTERAAASDGGRPLRFELVPELKAQLNDRDELTGIFDIALPSGVRRVRPEDVYRFDAPHEGILTYGAATIRKALKAQQQAANPAPLVELHQTGGTPLDNDAIDALIARWAAARRNENGAIGYTSQTIDARILGTKVTQLLNAEADRADIRLARMCGAPAWLADCPVSGSSITYANVSARSRELLDYLAMPYLSAIAGRFSLDDLLPGTQYAQINTTALLLPDFGDRMTAFKTALETGVYTLPELRALEHGTEELE